LPGLHACDLRGSGPWPFSRLPRLLPALGRACDFGVFLFRLSRRQPDRSSPHEEERGDPEPLTGRRLLVPGLWNRRARRQRVRDLRFDLLEKTLGGRRCLDLREPALELEHGLLHDISSLSWDSREASARLSRLRIATVVTPSARAISRTGRSAQKRAVTV